MESLRKTIGTRIRCRRIEKELTQDRLAELSGLHPTYIGLVERGEKNVTVETLQKITDAIDLPMSRVFEGVGSADNTEINFPLLCYELVDQCSGLEQERMHHIIQEITKIKNG